MRTPGEMGAAGTVLAARLFFEDNSLRETALKLARLIEGAASPSRPYFEALGVVLAHELARLNAGVRRREASVRGGLAGWQQHGAQRSARKAFHPEPVLRSYRD